MWLGFENCIAFKKPYLNPMHKASRLAFACKFVHWTKKIGTKSFGLMNCCLNLKKLLTNLYMAQSSQKYATNCLVPNFKFGQTFVMVWGAFPRFDKSPLVIIAQGERIVAHFVEKVYEGTLSGFYFMHDKPYKLTLMEDGAPIHYNKLPKNWRQAHGMKKLVWPLNSPDLNAIENLWKIVKDLLRQHNVPKNKQELIQLIQKVWNEVSLERLRQLISNMPNCMQSTVSANGGVLDGR